MRLTLDGEDLWWDADGRRERVGSLVRCFPTSSPEHWVSIRAETGEELALLRSLDELNAESRATVAPILEEKYHVPVISRIDSIEGSLAGKLIKVQTDDGQESLDVSVEADVDFSEYPCVVINERTKRRKYVIEDADALDRESRELMRRHLRRSRGRRGGRFR